MSFTIPEPYVWDESFKVFYDNLDEEHKGLFKAIFDVAANPTNTTTLTTLVTLVKKHFTNEEGMMTTKNYTDFTTHKAAHEAFVTKLTGVTTPVSTETIGYAKEWLVNHIKGTDFKYKGQL